KIAGRLPANDAWQLEVAAMLSQVGCIAVSTRIMDKVTQGTELTPQEAERFALHPRIGHDLLAHIPRMEEVARIVAYQDARFDGVGAGSERLRGSAIPLEARILKVPLALDAWRDRGKPEAEALKTLTQRQGWYDPAVRAALQEALSAETRYEMKTVRVAELNCQMILDEDVLAARGMRLLRKG